MSAIDDLLPGFWYEIPSSKLSLAGVYPDPPLVKAGPEDVIGAWGGGCFDSSRDKLMIWGGGHQDYGGNEIYAFSLTDLTWERLWGPSASIPDELPLTGYDVYEDGNPSSRHTYANCQYIASRDIMIEHGGAVWSSGQMSTSYKTWQFDCDAKTWSSAANLEATYAASCYTAVYDPTRDCLFIRGKFGLWKHDLSDNSYVKVYTDGDGLQIGATGTYDAEHDRIVRAGDGHVEVFSDLSSNPVTRNDYEEEDFAGSTEVITFSGPGFEYHPGTKKIIAWNGRTSDGVNPKVVYIFDIDSMTVSKRYSPPDNSVWPTDAAPNGTFNRWRYVAAHDVFVLVNDVADSVYVYKLGHMAAPANLRIVI